MARMFIGLISKSLLREAPCENASKNYSVGVSYVFLDFRRVRVCIRGVIFSPTRPHYSYRFLGATEV